MSSKRKKAKQFTRRQIILLLAVVLVISVPLIRRAVHPYRYIKSSTETLTVKIPYSAGDEAKVKVLTLTRGTRVELRQQGESESLVKYKDMEFNVDNDHLASSLEDCVQVSYVYPRRLINLQTTKSGKLSAKVVKKGEKVKVTEVKTEDLDRRTGAISWYRVEKGGKQYWLNGEEVETSKSAAMKNYAANVEYSDYWDQEYGDGYSKKAYIKQVDYKPRKLKEYKSNPIKEDVNSVHTTLQNLVKHKDYFLSLNDKTSINSITVEIKGDGGPVYYESDVVDDYLKDPDKAQTETVVTKKEMKELMKEFQDDGYYMIARIVTFKDSIFAKQNKSEAITDKDGDLIKVNDEYWPSAYSRKAWMYNVDIAKEAAKCNFNEIQFDYCRFPDGTATIQDELDMQNKYNESKVAAIQGFLTYAHHELESYKVYVAADIWAWPVVAQDDQDIGQFFPAIANAVDVVCPMAYTDLFASGAMDIDDPVSHPEKTLYKFNKRVKQQMNTIESDAVVRNWIRGYDYSTSEIKAQIRGINRAGYEGYLVWYGNGNPYQLRKIQKGFISSKIE
ncbi:putative glycoside hydrolase [Catenisphaera adipataccumulans]|uniref:DUF4015 domain-containing protein n=1 Tax=Catenisphaera adipataccumulans TaxID=700500 RepID=A0A7W8FUS6_9FIRM|nr:putative glycoside hydrolase [Catenisphaera adipataccumulans]MBB5182874.1 hypothetical protein [Catenisphaera adipataccumulans]